jgi:hypothetical protein
MEFEVRRFDSCGASPAIIDPPETLWREEVLFVVGGLKCRLENEELTGVRVHSYAHKHGVATRRMRTLSCVPAFLCV